MEPQPASGGTLEKGLAIVEFVGERGEVTATAVTEAFGLEPQRHLPPDRPAAHRGYLQESGTPAASGWARAWSSSASRR